MEQDIYRPHNANVFLADKLLPCPFCGGEAELTFIGNSATPKRKVEVACSLCRVVMKVAGIRFSSEVLAKSIINSWNKRT